MFNIEDIIGDIVYIDFQDISIYNNIGIDNILISSLLLEGT